MSSIWERFDDIASPEDVLEAKAKHDPVKAGAYDVVLEELETTENQNGDPMIKGRFRTKDNKLVFYNQNLIATGYDKLTAQNIATAWAFIEKLMGEELPYTKLSDFLIVVPKVPLGSEHRIEVSYKAKDVEQRYPIVKIIDPIETEFGDDEEIPY